MKRDAIDDGVPNPRGGINAKLSIAFACLSFVLVALRLLVRCLVNKLAGQDDYLIVGSLIMAIGLAVTYNKEAENGFGLHTEQVDYPHKVEAFKWFFAAQIIYKVATCLTKLSILSLYLRIFPNQSLRISTWVTGAIVIAYTLAACLVTVFGCHPISKAWDKKAEGKCVDIIQIWYSNSIMIILTDVMIILLPLNQIRRLQLPLFRKILLSGVFSLGIFVIACTIVRMTTVSPTTTSRDQIYYQATSNSWTFLEVNVGIICACLPVIRIPFRKLLSPFRTNRTTATGSRSHTNDHQLRTIGNVSSRGTTGNMRHDDDSYEDLIVQATVSKKLEKFNSV